MTKPIPKSISTPTDKTVCPDCGCNSPVFYVCPLHQVGVCYECITTCPEFIKWRTMLENLRFKKPLVRTQLWKGVV